MAGPVDRLKKFRRRLKRLGAGRPPTAEVDRAVPSPGLGRLQASLDTAKLRLQRADREAFGMRRDYDRIAAAVAGRRVPPALDQGPYRAPRDEAVQVAADAGRQRAMAILAEALAAGEAIEAATLRFARKALGAGRKHQVLAVVQALHRNESTRVAGALGEAVVATALERYDLGWARFHEVPPAVRRELAPVDFLRCGYLVGTKDARVETSAEVTEILAVSDALGAGTLIDIAELLVAADEPEFAARAAAVLDLRLGVPEVAQARAVQTDASGAEMLDDVDAWSWLRPWITRMREPEPVSAPSEGSLTFAMIDYKQPHWSHTSSNLGDYIQTLAATGHLLRHRNLSFEGEPELVATVEELHRRVRPDRALDTTERRVNLVTVNRDASSFARFPANTWMIGFGWYMHDMAGVRLDFPFHENLKPVFISFHVNNQAMLTPEGIEYLRRHAPIGCRDWNTVYLLLGLGVPAFFSGCLTTTTSTMFPDLAPEERPSGDVTLYVDSPGPKGTARIEQADEAMRWASMADNLPRVVNLLERYRRDFTQVVTSRLHCFLPAWSVGANVEFKPKSRADIRFNGLLDTTDADRRAMRDRILGLLEAVTTALVEGRSEEEVYAVWRDVTADHVAVARARYDDISQIAPPSFDVAGSVARVRSERVTIERSAETPGVDVDVDVDVAFALDGNLKVELDVVVTAMLANSSRPLRLWILSRDHDEADFKRFAAKFPEVTTNWLPCDRIDYGPVRNMIPHVTVSTMDRLLLPDLLAELDRIVYHDIDALPLGDIAELASVDLEGNPIAARSSVMPRARSAFERVRVPGRRPDSDPALAVEFLHRVYRAHRTDFVTFNAGILVLDLAMMRAEDFTRNFLPYVERFGLHDQDVLNFYAGTRRTALDRRWNTFPTQDAIDDPKIVHWAGPSKPWKPEYVRFKELWAEYAERSERRGVDGDPSRDA